MHVGFIDVSVYDRERKDDTQHRMVIACAHVKVSAVTDAWSDASTHYRTVADLKDKKDGEVDDAQILESFAADIVSFGARLLTGFWGSNFGRLPCLLKHSNAQIGANVFCPYFLDETLGVTPAPFPLMSFIYGPHGLIKCQSGESIPDWASYFRLPNLKVDTIMVDGEPLTAEPPVEADFLPRSDADTAHLDIHDALATAYHEQEARAVSTSAMTDDIRDDWLPLTLPYEKVLRWEFIPWDKPQSADWIRGWTRWTQQDLKMGIPHLMMTQPFGQVKGCSISKIKDTGAWDNRPQQRAWEQQVPGMISYVMFFGTSTPGKGTQMYKGQRLEYNRQQRAADLAPREKPKHKKKRARPPASMKVKKTNLKVKRGKKLKVFH